MLKITNFDSLDSLIDATVPKAIRRKEKMNLGVYTDGLTESIFLEKIKYEVQLEPVDSQQTPPCVRHTFCCLQGDGQQEQALQVLHRHGLLQHHAAACHPAQPAREPWVVHAVHALPGRDRAGPVSSAPVLSHGILI